MCGDSIAQLTSALADLPPVSPRRVYAVSRFVKLSTDNPHLLDLTLVLGPHIALLLVLVPDLLGLDALPLQDVVVVGQCVAAVVKRAQERGIPACTKKNS